MSHQMIDGKAIEFENVTKTFRIYHERKRTIHQTLVNIFDKRNSHEQLAVLRDISFFVKKGETFGVIGRNGAGKTTLMRLISNILKPDRGVIRTNGSVTPLLGMGTGFNPELSARDNIVIYGIILGFTKKEITSRIDEIIKFAELEKFADTMIKNFSSGMTARLAFSTALQVDPDILLVDEALSVGDVSFKKKSLEAFLSFKKRGKTIVFVSHDIQTVKEICDRALFLHEGRVQSIGPPDVVVDAYQKMLSSNHK